MIKPSFKRLIRVLRVVPSVLLASCTHEQPSDIRLEQVYVADISATPGFNREVAMGLRPQPLRLAIELSTIETFPLGASVVDGFCGEKQGPGYLGNGNLYKESDRNSAVAGSGSPIKSIRHKYLVLVGIVYKSGGPSPEWANFDLKDDSRDICLTTGAGTFTDVWRSNEVRISRSLIQKALREPIHMRIPLGPDDLP